MRDDAAAAELLRRIRASAAAEVKRLRIEVPPGNEERRLTSPAPWASSARDGSGAAAWDGSHAAAARARLTRMEAVARALDGMVPGDLRGEWAGPGSIVLLEDAASGERVESLLMPGHVGDLGPGYISLTSPIGEAVAGKGAGTTVTVVLHDDSVRTFRILAVRTARALVGVDARDLDASAGSRSGTRMRAPRAECASRSEALVRPEAPSQEPA